MQRDPIIVWLRHDLRLTDNTALASAVTSGRPVVPLYVRDHASDGRVKGGASAWWLERSLAALAHALAAKGSRLVLRRGDPAEVIPALVKELGAAEVVWCRVYGGDAVARDAELTEILRGAGVVTETFNAGLLIEPWALRSGAGSAYKVFTPFWRAARAAIGRVEVLPAPHRIAAPDVWPASDPDAEPRPTRPVWARGFSDWSPGEAGAQERLSEFLSGALSHYAEDRDRPALEATSRLSAHLHFGEIGPRQVWAGAHVAVQNGIGTDGQLDKLLAELGWREFNHHLLFERPDLHEAPTRPAFAAIPWHDDPHGLAAWKAGRTGYPIVDAGMRQLWATGWMHNRVRLIVGSFLVKHLLIDWREGERWFWDTLVDADAANNPANWQWVAGCGADASPFFRIFNPVVQGERFDGAGAYVRRWVPELAALPDGYIHAPWTAPEAVLRQAGVVLGQTYPKPIVDHAFARERALEAFRGLPKT